MKLSVSMTFETRDKTKAKHAGRVGVQAFLICHGGPSIGSYWLSTPEIHSRAAGLPVHGFLNELGSSPPSPGHPWDSSVDPAAVGAVAAQGPRS